MGYGTLKFIDFEKSWYIKAPVISRDLMLLSKSWFCIWLEQYDSHIDWACASSETVSRSCWWIIGNIYSRNLDVSVYSVDVIILSRLWGHIDPTRISGRIVWSWRHMNVSVTWLNGLAGFPCCLVLTHAERITTKPGMGVTKPNSSVRLFSEFCSFVKTHVSYCMLALYLAGRAAHTCNGVRTWGNWCTAGRLIDPVGKGELWSMLSKQYLCYPCYDLTHNLSSECAADDLER